MDQDQILTVLAVERAGSFTRAAGALNVTQSTVTARIRQIELELGVSIWERTTRRLVLTVEGKQLMDLFGRASVLFERMREVVEAEGFSRHVVIGSVHSQWSSGILPLLTSWTKNRLGVTWRLLTGHSAELLEGVRDGGIDVAITYFPSGEHGIQSKLLAQQDLVFLSVPHLAGTRVLDADDLRQLPLAYLNWGDPLTGWFQRELEGWTPTVQVDQAPLLIGMLLSGEYVGWMPRVLADAELTQGQLVEIPVRLGSAIPQRSVYAVTSERALVHSPVNDLWHHVTEKAPSILAGH